MENCKLKQENVIKRGKEVRTFFLKTKICFGSTKMGIFYREKHFTPGKKSGKITLPPQKNMPVTPLPGSSTGIVLRRDPPLL